MARILVVDDIPANIKLLEAVLGPRGHEVVPAASGAEALELARTEVDLVLLDIVMPEMDGYETCRRLRADPTTAHLPVVMITASRQPEKLRGLEAGADDFISKPFDQAELLARVGSLLRVKAYHDIITSQAGELAEWNRALEARVQEQVSELERLGRLRRFLSPQLAELVISSRDESILASHRREVAVMFCSLRGFTAFSEVAEPEDVMAVLAEFHEAIGTLIAKFDATVGFFVGGSLMVFFNDPLPCPDPCESAVRLALAMHDRTSGLAAGWARRGRELGLGIGIAVGFATLGEVGFGGRYDYTVVGSVANLAFRLGEETKHGETLLSSPVQLAVEKIVETQPAGEFTLKEFHKPITAYRLTGRRSSDPEADPATRTLSALTVRERDVALLAARGRTAPEIASELFIGQRTVESHLARIYAKLGVTSKLDLVHHAGELGLVDR